MAYKVLGQAAPLATTETVIYAVAAGKEAVVSSIVVCNRGAAATTFRISVSSGGGATASKDYIYYDLPIEAYDTFVLTGGLSLAASDVVRGYAGTANLSIGIFGNETDV